MDILKQLEAIFIKRKPDDKADDEADDEPDD